MFSANFSDICCSFAQNNFFEKSKMAGKKGGGHVLKTLLP